MKTRIALLVLSFPVMAMSSIVGVFNVLAALGHGRPLDLIHSVPFFALSLVWSLFLADLTK